MTDADTLHSGYGSSILHRLELRHLRYFVAVCDEMNFSRAATRLAVAQPALSRQIGHLEHHLGVPLFDRSRSQIKLTAAGSALLPRARKLLQTLVDDVEVTRRAGAGERGALEIGFVGSANFGILPSILKDFRSIYPEVGVFLTRMSMADLSSALINGRIQLAISRPSISDPEIENYRLLQEGLVVALPAHDPDASRQEFSISDLHSKQFVAGEPDVDPVTRVCEDAGFHPIIYQRAKDIQMMLSLVSVGVGWAILPESVAQWSAPNVVFRRLASPLHTELSLSYRRDNSSEAMLAFRRVVETHFAGDGKLGEAEVVSQ